jgi:hypothetical protein
MVRNLIYPWRNFVSVLNVHVLLTIKPTKDSKTKTMELAIRKCI